MAKNIVICSDGTGNSANKDRGTNVFKLFEALDLNPNPQGQNVRQIAFYDEGVGTESFKPFRLLGGAFGFGLSENVRQLYASLVRSYEPGDRIFLFGFSRGAYTVRTLGGFITNCGILTNTYDTDVALTAAVRDAYRVYRSRYMGNAERLLRTALGRRTDRKALFAERKKHFDGRRATHEGRIAFIGVWDTVDAVGLPFDHLADILNFFYRFRFNDFNLSQEVERACHAVAIDDERHTFHPVMWNETPADRRITQVWFPGVHSNVGGGYPKQGMSLVSLDWMMTEAESAGLRFHEADREWIRDHANVNDTLYNSRAGLAMYYRYKPRDIPWVCSKHGISTAKIHESAIERIALQTEGYAPGNLPSTMELVRTGGGTSLHAGTAKSVPAKYAGAQSLLDNVRALVRVRRWSHYVFILFSLALLGTLMWPNLRFDEGLWQGLASIGKIDGAALAEGFQRNTWLAISLASITLAFLIFQIDVEKRLKKEFSAFWRGYLGLVAPKRAIRLGWLRRSWRRLSGGGSIEEDDSAQKPA